MKEAERIRKAIAKNVRRMKSGKPVPEGQETWEARRDRLTARLQEVA